MRIQIDIFMIRSVIKCKAFVMGDISYVMINETGFSETSLQFFFTQSGT